MSETKDEDLSYLKTRAAVHETQIHSLEDRVTRHREKFDKRIDRLLEVTEKIENVMWKDGLVQAVQTNTEYIKDQTSQKNKIVHFIYRTMIAIVLSYIAYKVGLTA